MMRGGSHLYSLSRNQSLVILVLFKHAQSLCSRGRYVNCPRPSCHPRESTKPSQLLEGVRGGRWWDGDWSIQKAREMDDVHPLRAQSTPFLFPSMHLDISLSLSSSWCFEDTSWFILLSRPSSEPQYFFIFFIFFLLKGTMLSRTGWLRMQTPLDGTWVPGRAACCSNPPLQPQSLPGEMLPAWPGSDRLPPKVLCGLWAEEGKGCEQLYFHYLSSREKLDLVSEDSEQLSFPTKIRANLPLKPKQC